MKLLLPLVLLIIGTGAGVGAGIVLRDDPAPEEVDSAALHCGPTDEKVAGDPAEKPAAEPELTNVEYAKLANQFVVPVIADDQIVAMVVLSLGIVVPPEGKDAVFAVEPRLRDKMLQVMFNHSNVGGFSGNFTSGANMRALRQDLLQSAQSVLGEGAKDVLVLEIVRQDVQN